MSADPLLPEQPDLETPLKALVQEFDRDGKEERIWFLAEIQRCLLFWHGESSLTWHEGTHSWLSIWDAYDLGLVEEQDVEDYDRDINIYRPLLESIIAAASIEVPRIFFTPKKASDAQDIITSREATKASTLLDAVNNSKDLIQRAYFIISNQHYVAGYTYFERDAKKYGTEQVPQYGPVEKSRPTELCPGCQQDLTEEPPADAAGLSKFCPTCQGPVTPQAGEEKYEEEDVTGYTEVLGSKVCIQVFGPQNVKLPHDISKLEDASYLILDMELPVTKLADMHPEKADDILGQSTGDTERYDRWVRESKNTVAGSQRSRATYRRIWIRSWALNGIGPVDDRAAARQQYPDGVLVTMVNDLFIQATPSNMDDHWEITETSFSETIHDDPAGKALIPVSESQNDLLQYWMENIKQNIPETLVDASLFDLDKYSKIMARPGMRTPVKAKPGQPISQSIFETRPVSIPRESIELYRIFEQLGQFVSGALPSLFGGTQQAGSSARTTAFEYDASRQAALQRVALRISVINSWWARLKLKSVELYRANLEAPQESVSRSGSGFMPSMISPQNLSGKIQGATPEASSAFPTTWSQKRDFFLQALQSNNQQLIQVLFHPENSTLLKELIGIPELFIPGEQDRMKQLWEISQLLKEEPIPGIDPMTGQPAMQSSIPPDPRTDNGPTHIITCQNWLNSDDGREAEVNNKAGYENVLAHLLEHLKLAIQAQMQSQGPASPSGQEGGQAPPGPEDVSPAQGDTGNAY